MRFGRAATWYAPPGSFNNVVVLMFSLSAVTVAWSQTVIGTWQGTLPTGEYPRVVLRIADAGNGALRGSIVFPDLAPDLIPLLRVTYKAPELTAAVAEITFRGHLSADGKSIAGTWT